MLKNCFINSQKVIRKTNLTNMSKREKVHVFITILQMTFFIFLTFSSDFLLKTTLLSCVPNDLDQCPRPCHPTKKQVSWGRILRRNPDKSLTALPWDLYFLKLTQPLIISTVKLPYTVKEKGLKPARKYHLPYVLRNLYRNLKSENSQDYAQEPQWNCTFMNTASGRNVRLRILVILESL
jgi:hypothetical protein